MFNTFRKIAAILFVAILLGTSLGAVAWGIFGTARAAAIGFGGGLLVTIIGAAGVDQKAAEVDKNDNV